MDIEQGGLVHVYKCSWILNPKQLSNPFISPPKEARLLPATVPLNRDEAIGVNLLYTIPKRELAIGEMPQPLY